MRVFTVEEHKTLPAELFEGNDTLLKQIPDAQKATGSRLLGCYVEGWPEPMPRASYYVGLSWIEEGKTALQVMPKIAQIDFIKMFIECLACKDNEVQEKAVNIYGIDFKRQPIDTDGLRQDITPFIIIHFLMLLKPILQKGLKSNYVFREGNLQGKLKGKMMFAAHFKKNVAMNRYDKNYCRFQEYSVDCVENRILKKALMFASCYIAMYKLNLPRDLQDVIHQSKNEFLDVGDIRSAAEIERFRVNPLFKEYARAIKVAKLILRHFSFDIHCVEVASNKVMPFWIDMSLLFETYVLSLLKKRHGSNIAYHISTTGNEIDFGKIDERMIIDAKYIYHWDDKINHDNIRQLSGYARNKQIRRKLMGYINESEILPCMIVYPSADGITEFTCDKLLDEPCTDIGTYLKFFKLGIKIPVIQ